MSKLPPNVSRQDVETIRELRGLMGRLPVEIVLGVFNEYLALAVIEGHGSLLQNWRKMKRLALKNRELIGQHFGLDGSVN